MFIKKKPQPGDQADRGLFVEGAENRAASPEVIDAEPARTGLGGLHVKRKPQAEPDAGSAPGSSAFARFRGTKAEAPAGAVPPKKGFFSRGATTEAAPKGESKKGLFGGGKGSKPAKASAPTRSAAPKDSVDVVVELEGSRRVAWRVGSSSLQEVPLERVARAISFSRQEQRFSTEGPLSYNQAQDLALAEIGEEVRIVNGSKVTRGVYATTVERLNDMGAVQTGPGLFLLEQLLKDERAEDEELIFGLLLTGSDDNRSLAVLYHITRDGEVAATQITVNPDNLTFVLQQFASSRRLDPETAKFVLFKNEDLLKVAGKLQLYPAEAMWNGISLRRVLWTAALGAGVAAAGAGAFAGMNWMAVKSSKAQLAAATAKKTQANKAIDQLLATSVSSFARTQAIDLNQVTTRAGALWQPGSRVMVDAVPEKESFAVTLQLTQGGMFGTNPSVLHQLSLADVQPLLTAVPPEGCTKEVPNISGGMNAVEIIVTCESAPSPLAAYRLN